MWDSDGISVGTSGAGWCSHTAHSSSVWVVVPPRRPPTPLQATPAPSVRPALPLGSPVLLEVHVAPLLAVIEGEAPGGQQLDHPGDLGIDEGALHLLGQADHRGIAAEEDVGPVRIQV